MDPLGWIMLVMGTICLILVVTYVLYKYANFKRTPIYALVNTWIGWFFAFVIVLLLPLDVAMSTHDSCKSDADDDNSGDQPWINLDCEVLTTIWRIIYWTTFALCWTAFPILQSYSYAGEFTPLDRFRAALKENLLLYVILFAIGAVLITIIAIQRGFGFDEIVAIAIAGSNAWGLLLLMCMLGYGLVEIPKVLWRHSDKQKLLAYYQFRAAVLKERYDKARKHKDQTLRLVKKYSEKITQRDPFRPYIDQIITKCGPEYKELTYGEGSVELTYSKLVKLHCKVMSTEHKAIATQSMYETLLEKAFALEDVIKSASSMHSEFSVRWSFRPRRDPSQRFATVLNAIEYFWRVYGERIALKALSILLVAFSVSVVWSEVFFWVDAVDLSIFSWLFKWNTRFEIQWFFALLPLLYICICAYWSLFRFKLFNLYQLIPHSSDASSLLFNVMYISRLTAPIAYNFLLMIKNDKTAFYQVMGAMETAPFFLGNEFNLYFPIILVLFCLSTTFNLYGRFVMGCCGNRAQKYVFDEDFSDSLITQGRQILSQERAKRERALSPNNEPDDDDPNVSSRSLLDLKKVFGLKSSSSSRLSSDTQSLLEKGEAREPRSIKSSRSNDSMVRQSYSAI